MILLQAVNIAKSFGAGQVLQGVNFTLRAGERTGIVGVNGAGKSTLLKILAGILQPDQGEVIRARDLSMTYMAQDGGLESKRTIWEEMLSVFAPLLEMEKQLREMEHRMGDPALAADRAAYGQLLQNYDSLSAGFRSRGGFEYETNIRGILHGLKFGDIDYATPVENLSGGQKTRLALARCLVHDPRVLILDEPASGLDPRARAEMKEIIRGLKQLNKAVLISSHILPELAEMCDEVAIMEAGKLVASGTVAEITAASRGARQLKVEVLERAEELAAFLATRPGVTEAWAEGRVVKFLFGSPHREQAELLQAIISGGWSVAEFGEVRRNLEDAFMAVTGEGEEDNGGN